MVRELPTQWGFKRIYVHKEREREGFGLTYKGFNLCSSYVNGLYLESSNFTLKKTAVNQFKPLEQQKKNTEPNLLTQNM